MQSIIVLLIIIGSWTGEVRATHETCVSSETTLDSVYNHNKYAQVDFELTGARAKDFIREYNRLKPVSYWEVDKIIFMSIYPPIGPKSRDQRILGFLNGCFVFSDTMYRVHINKLLSLMEGMKT